MESNMNPKSISAFFRGRGVALNRGLLQGELSAIADPSIRKLYAEFNGFPEGVLDGASGIRVLPFDEMTLQAYGVIDAQARHVFADILMGSDQFSCNLGNGADPIFSVEDGKEISPSWSDFWQSFLNGEFDFQ